MNGWRVSKEGRTAMHTEHASAEDEDRVKERPIQFGHLPAVTLRCRMYDPHWPFAYPVNFTFVT